MGHEDFHKSLQHLARAVKKNPRMSEGDVYSCFVGEGFFGALGYEAFGIDIRAQERVGTQYADYDCVDDIEQSIFILEAKKPAEQDLLSYRDKQLKEKYVLPKKSLYGVLTNGSAFYLFKREGERLVDKLKIEDLASTTKEQALEIYSCLKKPAYEYTDLARTLAEISKIDVKSLSEEVNRESFYEIFKLKQEETGRPTKFTKLVFALMDLFDDLMRGEKSQFLEGAYKFWERSYAHKPSKLPANWRKLQKLMREYDEKGEDALYKFMFSLETAHNIVAKLILAKVAEDSGFRNASALEKLRSYMGLKFGEARITYIAYPFAVKETFDALRYSLVESIFEEDIFDWWQDCSLRVGSNVHEWRARDSFEVRTFGEALARLFFALRSFDFRGLREDILGELYQHYFDPETRKALGEFYTPIEVVDYILDAVDYEGEKVLNQRLLDPACGSGTFIVEALKRYLHAAEARVTQRGEAHWSIILRDLCERPKIIGFDINPFARLMAQMRFMMEIIPYYSRAQSADSSFVLTTVPIFRTDSLEIETKTGRFQKQLGEFAGDIKFFMRLPVISKEPKEGEEQFIPVSFSIPAWEKLRDTLQGNKENYFLLLRQCFQVIKDSARKDRWEVDKPALKREFSRLFDEAENLAMNMLDYVNPILGQIYVLRKQYSDGRLIKTLEDLVLAGILKNYFAYDYVVGNPPYVRVQLLEKEKKALYEQMYSTARGLYDIYVLFIERGIDWLTEKARLGYIVSNKFMTRGYGENLRDFILKNSKIFEIIDFGDSGVFKDATNYPCIITLSKEFLTTEKETHLIKCVRVAEPIKSNERFEETNPTLLDISSHINESEYSTQFYDIFNFPQNEMSNGGWELMPLQEKKALEKIRSASTKLFDILIDEIGVGVQTSADKIFVITKNEKDRLKMEDEIVKKFLFGENVRKWKISYGKRYLIYPYYNKDGNSVLIPEDEFESKFPKTYSYLLEHKEHLLKRWGIKSWYELSTKRSFDWFEQFKILTAGTAHGSNFAFDDDYSYYPKGGGGIFGITLKKKGDLSVYIYILGLLNSKVIDFVFKHISPMLSGKYYTYHEDYLKRLPIKLPQNKTEQKHADEITERVEKILGLAKIEQRVENFPEPYLEELKEEIEEWAVIKSVGQGEVDTELKERYVTEALRMGGAKKGKEPAIKLPRTDAMVKKILERYDRDKERLKEKSIAELEEEIDERVYRLYGLGEEDKKVIEEFLEKF